MSRELIKGVEYYFDKSKKDAGIYIDFDEEEEYYLFKPTLGYTYEKLEGGLVPFYSSSVNSFVPCKTNKK